ncbi:MAG: isoleucine--tRNA ligase [Clostridia bacterium]|nr:isoleucine--tRNA ligase [Clostridia bacterium]
MAKDMSKDYTSTLNLPNTAFSMRANLPQREPETIKYWDSIDLYGKMQKAGENKPTFILHDGPPFSNGNIHMGTAMNKILKDFINKSKTMMGFRAPYIPGWDNHGMPIESAIIKKNKLDRKKMSIPEFRNACHKFASDFVDIQRGQFIRLGVSGDWQHPYLTMNPSFEAREVKVFGEMFKKGYIYKGLKPVYWCPHDETALAEAEIEYKDEKCTSIYVKFKVKEDMGKLSDVCDLDKTYFIIWTTTTWTLPGNLAIALNPTEDYVVVKADNGEFYIVAEALCESTMKAGNVTSYEIVKHFLGQELEYLKAMHPFLDRESVIVNADYVTMDSGTGCVHTAPGFGADDYQTCRKYKIESIVPVDDRGYQTADAGKYAGMYYAESNEAILADMKESGALFASEEVVHSYPHCWRCKHPIIFRATPQWFCSVDSFKEDAVKASDAVQWIPAWGAERMVQMIRERADWCISRQRHWGLPIPVFYCEDCHKPVCTDETIEKVSRLFGEKGSNAWFDTDASEILGDAFVCPHCGGKHFSKETDTLDGWFDSGSSHFAVLEGNPQLKWPADLYLEGADQYRGWFQSSMLTAVGAKGQGAPYKAVLTHGWVVDGEGKAMHKSLGNSIAPEEMIKKYGADIVRLWVASSDYRVDVRVSDTIFGQLSETYRKIRNTARILMANLGDFNPDTDMLDVNACCDIDKWVISKVNDLAATVRRAYNDYEFHVVYHGINNFCTVDLSKLYIDITKDRLYVEKKNGSARRSAQTAMYIVLSALTRLVAPLIAFTSEEIWQTMPHKASDVKESVFLNEMPDFDEALTFADLRTKWDRLFEHRDDVMKALEVARAEKRIGKSLDAKVTVYTQNPELFALLSQFPLTGADGLSTVYIVSKATVVDAAAPENAFCTENSDIAVLVEPADGHKCDRCWSYSEQGVQTEGGFLCERCRAIVESAKSESSLKD